VVEITPDKKIVWEFVDHTSNPSIKSRFWTFPVMPPRARFYADQAD
jgi:hypothetical protein